MGLQMSFAELQEKCLKNEHPKNKQTNDPENC